MSMTPPGIETATFRLVAQHLNHWATAVPSSRLVLAMNEGTVRRLNLLQWNTSKESSCVCRNLVTFQTSHYRDVYSIFSVYKLLNFTLWNHAAMPPSQAPWSVNAITIHLMNASLIYIEQLISLQSGMTFLVVFNALEAVFHFLSLGITRGLTTSGNWTAAIPCVWQSYFVGNQLQIVRACSDISNFAEHNTISSTSNARKFYRITWYWYECKEHVL